MSAPLTQEAKSLLEVPVCKRMSNNVLVIAATAISVSNDSVRSPDHG